MDEIDRQSEAEAREIILQLSAKRWGLKNICRRLIVLGIPSPDGKIWSSGMVKEILRREGK